MKLNDLDEHIECLVNCYSLSLRIKLIIRTRL